MRSDFFATMGLADAQLAAGDLEQTCGTALRALMAGEQIRSARCVKYLREFGQHLARIGDVTVVTDSCEQARSSRLWRIASRTEERPPNQLRYRLQRCAGGRSGTHRREDRRAPDH
jgi:hypothetical protein